ncbi:MAG: hypothetical protein C0478_16630, partial [Planctomyces sp.]|nr:hypothetical protein [Planctomyces sp.]
VSLTGAEQGVPVAAPAVPAAPNAISWRASYRKAWDESKATGKPMLVNVSAKWCLACRTLEQQTLNQPKVQQMVNENFIAVQLDADAHRELVASFRVTGLPTCLIVAPDLTIEDRIIGMQPAATFTGRLEESVRPNIEMASRNSPVSAAKPANGY